MQAKIFIASRNTRGTGPRSAPYPAGGLLLDVGKTPEFQSRRKSMSAKRYASAERRKRAYVPALQRWLCSQPAAVEAVDGLATLLREQKRPVIIFDGDGPRTPEGSMQCLELTEDLLRERIHDERHPFGCGYVVGAMAAGIPAAAYCK